MLRIPIGILVRFSTFCAAVCMMLAISAQASTQDMLDMSDQLDQLDSTEFGDRIRKAEACTKQRDFACAEKTLIEAAQFIVDPKDKQAIQLAQSNLVAERERVAEEERQRQLAEERERQRMEAARKKEGEFQWGKLAAMATGAAIGGIGQLSSEQQANLFSGMIRDSMAGVDGMGNTQAVVNQYNSNTGSASGDGLSEAERNKAAAKACEPEGKAAQPYNDGQLDPFCQLATFNNCIKRKTGITALDPQTQESCQSLKASASALNLNPNLCSACR